MPDQPQAPAGPCPQPVAARRRAELGSAPVILNQFLFVEHGSMTFAPGGEAPRPVRAGILCAGLFGPTGHEASLAAAGDARNNPGA